MSSFSTLNAALGLYVNNEEKVLKLNPAFEEITLPLFLSDAVIKLTVQNKNYTFEILEGSLNGYEIILPDGCKYTIL